MAFHTIPFNIGDWLGGTLGWDAVECGAYFNLLIANYQLGEDGIPAADVRKLARCTPKQWERISAKVLAKFDRIEDANSTRFSSQKVSKIARKIAENSSKKSANALKRWNNDDANAMLSNIQYPISNIQNRSDQGADHPNPKQFSKIFDKKFDLDLIMRDETRQRARDIAPGWDLHALIGFFNEAVRSGKFSKPDHPDKAFLAWIPKFTKGKRP